MSSAAGAAPAVVVVDYGVGNLGSIVNMFRRIGVLAVASSEPDVIAAAPRLLLPGVGAFDHAMELLRKAELEEPLGAFRATGRPVLGICLGMQLLGSSSAEGEATGLGWHDATTERLVADDAAGVRVPNMGWCDVDVNVRVDGAAPLFGGIDSPRFYFLHSYLVVGPAENERARATHGSSAFTCAVSFENVHGVQFHPEKSHRYGMQLFRNFCDLG